ncbi:unnamed protein product [Clonostachys rosea]|uniref:G-protein coupled receptors family 1 profile domain-containing protein n=1 Tax=Bionectria ochroleuca TaxID=29856 RepID=A0ABY6TXV3_BIOOC|nr:unnamed protein product [Clonostachys rosea]
MAGIIQDVLRSDESLGLVLPVGNRVGPLLLNFVSLVALSICGTRRVQNVRHWGLLPLSYWILLIIYADTILFVVSTALLNAAGINSSRVVCQAAIFLCLVFYFVSKILIYLFLVEKAHIVRGRGKRRLESKVYLFNCFGMLLAYAGLAVANFVRRIGYLREDGMCIIGMERPVLIPLVIFEVIVNLYLTTTFLIPIRNLHSYDNNPRLKKVVIRTFVGSLATLTSTVVNIVLMVILDGEPAWMCFMICSTDILFTTLVLHWVTVSDSVGTSQNERPRNPGYGYSYGNSNANPDHSTMQSSLKGANTNNAIHQRSDGAQGVAEASKNGAQMEMEIIGKEKCAGRETTLRVQETRWGSDDTGSGSQDTRIGRDEIA